MALFPRPSSWLARRHHALLFPTSPPSGTRTLFTPPRPSWHTRTGLASSRVQVYTSHVHDPYLNLAAEHFLLQHSHPDATVLFLYVNDPCVVLGRNQNPWVEANLGLVRRGLPGPDQKEKVHLVRRRSGGGAVFHDRGNVNYSVICPARVFDRDRHAAMVVRALGALRVPGALAVNARHDIVVSHDNAHATHATNPTPASVFKVSGSAYKLTRLRALHHGTCLLASPHLARIGPLLRGPAAPYTRARGVESVRSPVRNVGGVATSNAAFCAAVRAEFVAMYGPPDVDVDLKTTTGGIGVTGGEGDDVDDFGHEEITKGYRELTVSLSFFLFPPPPPLLHLGLYPIVCSCRPVSI